MEKRENELERTEGRQRGNCSLAGLHHQGTAPSEGGAQQWRGTPDLAVRRVLLEFGGAPLASGWSR